MPLAGVCPRRTWRPAVGSGDEQLRSRCLKEEWREEGRCWRLKLADGRGHRSGPHQWGGQGRGMGERVRGNGRQEGRKEEWIGRCWPRMMEETGLWGELGSPGAGGLGVSGWGGQAGPVAE